MWGSSIFAFMVSGFCDVGDLWLGFGHCALALCGLLRFGVYGFQGLGCLGRVGMKVSVGYRDRGKWSREYSTG